MAAYQLPAAELDLVAAYEDDRRDIGQRPDHKVLWGARWFCAHVGEMRKLRAEMHRRMLGNGYCARPVGMDCHFESICESCTFFQTTIEFRPTLQRQRDDAEAKGQIGRQKIFDGLLARLDQDVS